MGVSSPPHERPWRTLAALAVAPWSSMLPLALLKYLDYVDQGMESSFSPYIILLTMALAYIASAIVGAMAMALRACFKAPRRAGIVVALFGLSAGVWGIVCPGSLTDRLLLTLLFAALSLPVSASYCAIARIRWW